MGRGQAARRLHANAQHFFQFQRPVAVQALLQGRAGDVLHDEVGQTARIDGVDGDDVLVADGGGSPGLAANAGGPRRCGQLRRQHLDGHQPIRAGSRALSTTPMPPRPSTSRTS